MEPHDPIAYELIPLLLGVLLLALIAMAYSIWCDIGDDDDTITYDLDTLHPYSGREWQRDDLP
jgi:hypothetical protein